MRSSVETQTKTNQSNETLFSGIGTIFPSMIVSVIIVLSYVNGERANSPLITAESVLFVLLAFCNLLLLWWKQRSRGMHFSLWKFFVFPILSVVLATLFAFLLLIFMLSSSSSDNVFA